MAGRLAVPVIVRSVLIARRECAVVITMAATVPALAVRGVGRRVLAVWLGPIGRMGVRRSVWAMRLPMMIRVRIAVC